MTETLQPVTKVMPDPKLDETTFKQRYLSQFIDPNFDPLRGELGRIADVAWQNYSDSRKAPVTRKAGPGYADPDYDLSVDWIAGKEAIERAQAAFDDPAQTPHVLLINGSSRSEHTCPGESSKSYRMVEMAREVVEKAGFVADILDLSRLSSEYGRKIHPCKACFSTAAPLCHWPCSCYPNHSLGQTQDWMNDIYPMWVRACGIFIVSPTYWYTPSSPLKSMIDRLVCADGGNPDPTKTHGKHAEEARKIEMDGWDYPKHLKGRLFSVVVHGDVEGVENVRRSLSDWLKFMDLEPAGVKAELDRYIGYWKPYATNHEEYEHDLAVQGEIRQAATTLVDAIKAKREGKWTDAGAWLTPPRQK